MLLSFLSQNSRCALGITQVILRKSWTRIPQWVAVTSDHNDESTFSFRPSIWVIHTLWQKTLQKQIFLLTWYSIIVFDFSTQTVCKFFVYILSDKILCMYLWQVCRFFLYLDWTMGFQLQIFCIKFQKSEIC